MVIQGPQSALLDKSDYRWENDSNVISIALEWHEAIKTRREQAFRIREPELHFREQENKPGTGELIITCDTNPLVTRKYAGFAHPPQTCNIFLIFITNRKNTYVITGIALSNSKFKNTSSVIMGRCAVKLNHSFCGIAGSLHVSTCWTLERETCVY